MKNKMTSLEALKKLEYFTNWSSDEDIEESLFNLWGNVACRTIKKDLELVNKFKKIIIFLLRYIYVSDEVDFDTYYTSQLSAEEQEIFVELLEECGYYE